MNEKERMAEIITNSLTEEFEVSEVNNVQYLHGAPQSETEFRAIIKSKYDSDFIGYIWIEFDSGFEHVAYVEFCKNLLINFQKVFIEGEHIVNKMKQSTYELSFMYAYCLGEHVSPTDFNNIDNIIQHFQYDGNYYRLHINIKESNIWLSSELKLKEDKMIFDIKILVSIKKEQFMIKITNDIQEQDKLKRIFLKQFAAIPLNKELEELKLDDYKLLHMIHY